MSLTRRFKGYFLHGLAVLLPSILTIWVFVWGYTFIQENISQHINRGLVHIIALVTHDDIDITDSEVQKYIESEDSGIEYDDNNIKILVKDEYIRKQARFNKRKTKLAEKWVDGPGSIVGFIIAVISVCIFGALLASYVGKRFWRMTENFIMNTPLLRNVYPYIKQVTDFLLTQEEDQKRLFSRVVAVEYPKKNIWSVGFVTGAGLKSVVDNVRGDFLTVIIPTSPTPFTGFVITVPKKQTIDLDMTIEEALRFIISGGVIAPMNQRIKMDEQTKENLTNPHGDT